MRQFAFSTVVAWLANATVCVAQLPELMPGTLVRVEAPGFASRPVVGTVATWAGDTLTLVRAGSRTTHNPVGVWIAIPAVHVERVLVSTGRSHSLGARKGAKLAFWIGLGVAALESLLLLPSLGPGGGGLELVAGLVIVNQIVFQTLFVVGGFIIGSEVWRQVYPAP